MDIHSYDPIHMILPSGNTYSIFYSGLTDVINRSVYSLSISPKITLARAFLEWFVSSRGSWFPLWCTVLSVTWRGSSFSSCIWNGLRLWDRSLPKLFEAFYCCHSSTTLISNWENKDSVNEHWMSTVCQTSRRLHPLILTNCPEELPVMSLKWVTWLSQRSYNQFKIYHQK